MILQNRLDCIWHLEEPLTLKLIRLYEQHSAQHAPEIPVLAFDSEDRITPKFRCFILGYMAALDQMRMAMDGKNV